MTKCGRYGSKQSEFDYSPATIRASVERSLARLHTTYLDTVYLHDVEYVCTPVGPAGAAGNPDAALAAQSAEYGLAEGQEGKIWGPGDQKILDAVAELRRLQDEGMVKNVGISGAFPLSAPAPPRPSLSSPSASPTSCFFSHPRTPATPHFLDLCTRTPLSY